jgi:hypothetical protein
MIEWRGRTFILPSSPIAMLYALFGMDERFAQWAAVLLENRAIPRERSPLLREQLEATEGTPEEVLPTLVVLPERIFGIDYFKRNSSQ